MRGILIEQPAKHAAIQIREINILLTMKVQLHIVYFCFLSVKPIPLMNDVFDFVFKGYVIGHGNFPAYGEIFGCRRDLAVSILENTDEVKRKALLGRRARNALVRIIRSHSKKRGRSLFHSALNLERGRFYIVRCCHLSHQILPLGKILCLLAISLSCTDKA